MSDLRVPGTSIDPALAELRLRDWHPVAAVRREMTPVGPPAVQAVDAHNHLGRWLSDDGGWVVERVPELLELMDRTGIAAMVNLDGRWGAELDDNVARYDAAHPGRFATFCHLDWSRLLEPRSTEKLVADLARAAAQGAKGLKVWKDLGLSVRDASGALVLPDDARLTDVFTAAGEVGLPVLIHTADPIAFFGPLDPTNERLDELTEMPSWWFGDTSRYPTFDRLLDGMAEVVRRSPGTTFIGAHVGCAAEDLDLVDALLRECANFHVDLGGRLGELGRQPRRFARLVRDHPDRVLFGTDCFPLDHRIVESYVRFLETDDECFAYWPGEPVPPQGRWDIGGAALEPHLLPALYAGNARRLIDLGSRTRKASG